MTELRAKRRAKVRDGARCAMCYRAGNHWHLHSHHIIPKAQRPDLAATVDNLVTLCLHCHLGIVHGGRIADAKDARGNWALWVPHLRRCVNRAKGATL